MAPVIEVGFSITTEPTVNPRIMIRNSVSALNPMADNGDSISDAIGERLDSRPIVCSEVPAKSFSAMGVATATVLDAIAAIPVMNIGSNILPMLIFFPFCHGAGGMSAGVNAHTMMLANRARVK